MFVDTEACFANPDLGPEQCDSDTLNALRSEMPIWF